MINDNNKNKPNYQRFFLTEIVALVQQKYKIELLKIFYENKQEYIISKPRFNIQVYTPKESEIYKTIYVVEFFYFKITRFLY